MTWYTFHCIYLSKHSMIYLIISLYIYSFNSVCLHNYVDMIIKILKYIILSCRFAFDCQQHNPNMNLLWRYSWSDIIRISVSRHIMSSYHKTTLFGTIWAEWHPKTIMKTRILYSCYMLTQQTQMWWRLNMTSLAMSESDSWMNRLFESDLFYELLSAENRRLYGVKCTDDLIDGAKSKLHL